MRWSVIFSTSYAGSCLRGAGEKEVFFERGKRKAEPSTIAASERRLVCKGREGRGA